MIKEIITHTLAFIGGGMIGIIMMCLFKGVDNE